MLGVGANEDGEPGAARGGEDGVGELEAGADEADGPGALYMKSACPRQIQVSRQARDTKFSMYNQLIKNCTCVL